MSDDKDNFDPNEMQKELEDLVKSKFGDKIKFVSRPAQFDPLERDGEQAEEEPVEPLEFDFQYIPKEVYQYLDEYIIGQVEAKKTLSIAICDHYNHIKKDQRESLENIPPSHYSKQNVLMLGPTGVGKTYIIKKIADLIGVPFVKADATKFTEAGYVGANIEDTVRDLITQANGNVKLAEYGIVYIDEADKLAGSRKINGKDISGRGVQNGLLKLLEETDIDTRNPMDMMAQMNMMMGKKKMPKTINTRNILFILSGAFTGLEDIIKKRMNINAIGFSNKTKSSLDMDDIFKHVSTKDLTDFGLEPELIGRLPVRVNCHSLSVQHLFDILKDSKESIILQYHDAFGAYGIELDFTDDALMEIAKMAHLEKTGARSLMTIIEKILRDFKFELPSSEIKFLKIDKHLVLDPSKVLKDLLAEYN
ncbi:MAG: ATP-dependent protease [Halobacteriovoraceae bacterium]|nr:ATP-dependent protease [Halobacteriovoraceae bacterium]|tara:strand:- start:3246 stop:4508 length:1263 start_codon:yes stop_codon:yes gene_type:complete